MQLNKDGTATLTIQGQHLHLTTPTWGQLKEMKKRALKIGDDLGEISEGIRKSLTEDQLELYELTVTQIRSGGASEASEFLKNQTEEDTTAITGALERLSAIRDTAQELTAIWWTETIEVLTDTKVSSDDLPGGLANESSIDAYLRHVQSVPFDFSQ